MSGRKFWCMMVTGDPAHPIVLLLVAALVALSSGCSRDASQDVGRNPYFVRGLSLREAGKYEEAAQAFSRCLRMSPESAKTHLQLATLYEDHLADPLSAVYHYRTYSRLAGSDAVAGTGAWLRACERELLAELRQLHPEDRQVAEGTPVADPRPSALSPTERERNFIRMIKRLNGELAALRAQRVEGLAAAVTGTAEENETTSAAGTATSDSAQPEEAATVVVRSYTVKQGDTLSAISAAVYGSTRYWGQLAEWNKDALRNGDILQPGMVLEVPPLPELMPEEAQ